MKRPAFQFYPADWRRDSALQSCSVAARGLWIELMCVMHDCEPYGVLSVNGKAMSASQLSRLVGEQEKVVTRLLSELEDAGVCSRDEQGRLFSRRMVKDEAVRESRANGGHAGADHGYKGGEYGKKGGRPKKQKEGSFDDGKTPLKTPLDGFEEPPPSSSSSSSSSNTEEPNGSVGSADRLPRCDTQSVVDLYHQALPELPAVRVMSDARQKAVRSFWKFVLTSKKSDGSKRAETAEQALAWIGGYFDRARHNDFLMGRGSKAPGHEGWQCDFDFLLSEKGKKHVLEKTQVHA